jgi:hypothetical protein
MPNFVPKLWPNSRLSFFLLKTNFSVASESDMSSVKVRLADNVEFAASALKSPRPTTYRHGVGDHREETGCNGNDCQLSRFQRQSCRLLSVTQNVVNREEDGSTGPGRLGISTPIAPLRSPVAVPNVLIGVITPMFVVTPPATWTHWSPNVTSPRHTNRNATESAFVKYIAPPRFETVQLVDGVQQSRAFV